MRRIAAMVWLVTASCATTAETRAHEGRNAGRIDALERRVTGLEVGAPRPASAGPPATGDAQLVARIEELEAAVRALEATVDRLARRPTATVPATVPPRRFGPDSAKVYRVPLDDSPAIGPRVAPITIVASLQFPEPYTHKVWPTLEQLMTDYKRDLRIVVKMFVVHPRATASSIAACAAAYQGGLGAFERAVYAAAEQPEPTGAPAYGLRELDELELRELARALRLDLRHYDRDLVTCTAALARDRALVNTLGQRGVPAFWINGRPLAGAQPLAAFRALIDEERAKQKADRAKGGKLADYYDRIMRTAEPTATP